MHRKAPVLVSYTSEILGNGEANYLSILFPDELEVNEIDALVENIRACAAEKGQVEINWPYGAKRRANHARRLRQENIEYETDEYIPEDEEGIKEDPHYCQIRVNFKPLRVTSAQGYSFHETLRLLTAALNNADHPVELHRSCSEISRILEEKIVDMARLNEKNLKSLFEEAKAGVRGERKTAVAVDENEKNQTKEELEASKALIAALMSEEGNFLNDVTPDDDSEAKDIAEEFLKKIYKKLKKLAPQLNQGSFKEKIEKVNSFIDRILTIHRNYSDQYSTKNRDERHRFEFENDGDVFHKALSLMENHILISIVDDLALCYRYRKIPLDKEADFTPYHIDRSNIISKKELTDILDHYHSTSPLAYCCLFASDRSGTIRGLRKLALKATISKTDIQKAIGNDNDSVRRLSLFNDEKVLPNDKSTDDIIVLLRNRFKAN